MARSDNSKGIVLFMGAVLIVPLMDALAKYLSETVSPGEATFVRMLLQSLFALPFVLSGLRLPDKSQLKFHCWRGVLIAASSICFFSALKFMPIVDALAVFFIAPFVVTFLSKYFLQEVVGWPRILACCIGFLGAMLIIGPSTKVFGLAALLPIATSVFFSSYLIVTKKQSSAASPLEMMFFSGFAGALFTLLILLIGNAFAVPELTLSIPPGKSSLLLIGMGVVSFVSHLLIIKAARYASASVLAPLQYLEIVSATLLGWFIFRGFPTPITWVGVVIIVCSGVYVFHRERKYK